MKDSCSRCMLEGECPGYYDGCFDAVNYKTLEEKRIDRLYDLLHKLDGNDTEGAAALRWAIFTLEQEIKGISQSR